MTRMPCASSHLQALMVHTSLRLIDYNGLVGEFFGEAKERKVGEDGQLFTNTTEREFPTWL